jgi:hypothetical protein
LLWIDHIFATGQRWAVGSNTTPVLCTRKPMEAELAGTVIGNVAELEPGTVKVLAVGMDTAA